jgi:hypothetical protein
MMLLLLLLLLRISRLGIEPWNQTASYHVFVKYLVSQGQLNS